MPATVVLQIDNQTTKGFREYTQDIGQAAQATSKGDKALAELEAQAARTRAGVAELKSKVKEWRQEVDAAAASQQAAAKNSANWAQKVTATSTAIFAGIGILKQMTEWAKKAGAVLQELADRGNPGAKQLVDNFTALKERLIDMANDPGIQNLLDKMAKSVAKTTEAIGSLPTSKGGFAEVGAGLAELSREKLGYDIFGGLFDSSVQDLQKLRAEELKVKGELQLQAQARAKQVEITKQQKQAEADVQNIRNQIVADIKRSNLEQETSEKRLLELREKALGKIKELADKGNLTEDKRKELLQDAILLEERRKKLIEEQAQAAKKQADDQKKFVSALKADWAQAAALTKQAFSKAQEEANKLAEAAIAKQKKAVDELAAKLQELRGGGDKDQNLLQGIRGNLSDQATLQQIAANRASKFSGAKDQDRARRSALEQFRQGGQFDPAEVAKAQDELTQQVINQAVASGQLNQKQADSLRQAAKTLQEQSNVQQQQQQDIEAIFKALEQANNATNGTARRQRAQRGANGP